MISMGIYNFAITQKGPTFMPSYFDILLALYIEINYKSIHRGTKYKLPTNFGGHAAIH